MSGPSLHIYLCLAIDVLLTCRVVSEINFGRRIFIPGTPTIDSMVINEPAKLKAEFLASMWKVNIVRTLARVLENSPHIHHLSVAVEITGLPFKLKKPITPERLKKAAVIVTQQLGQHFANSQSFAPLLDLTNVQKFSPTMCLFIAGDTHRYSPSPSTLRRLCWRKKEVEEQWMSPPVKRWIEYSLGATEVQRRAFANKYSLPFAAHDYGLGTRKLLGMLMDEKYGEMEHTVQNRSGLAWSEVDIAEAEMLGKHGRVALDFEPSTTPSLPPSSILPPFPCLPQCPCAKCLDTILSPCPDRCVCDDCWIPPPEKSLAE